MVEWLKRFLTYFFEAFLEAFFFDDFFAAFFAAFFAMVGSPRTVSEMTQEPLRTLRRGTPRRVGAAL
jgi:hypothetical protein